MILVVVLFETLPAHQSRSVNGTMRYSKRNFSSQDSLGPTAVPFCLFQLSSFQPMLSSSLWRALEISDHTTGEDRRGLLIGDVTAVNSLRLRTDPYVIRIRRRLTRAPCKWRLDYQGSARRGCEGECHAMPPFPLSLPKDPALAFFGLLRAGARRPLDDLEEAAPFAISAMTLCCQPASVAPETP